MKWEGSKIKQFKSDTKVSEIVIPATLILVAFFVGLCGGMQLLDYINDNVKRQHLHTFYIFWSFQFLAILINGVHTWYIPEIPIVVIIPVLTFIYSVIVVICYEIKLEVPFKKSVFWSEDSKRWIVVMSVFATWNTFMFFIYMAYTLPWIVLGFYLYPIKILVRISAIVAAGLLIVVNSYIILLYFEEFIEKCRFEVCICISKCFIKPCICISKCFIKPCIWICKCFIKPCICICKYFIIKPCICICKYFIIKPCTCICENVKACLCLTSPCWSEIKDRCKEFCNEEQNWEVFAALSKCCTGVLVLLCFGGIGYLLHHIIFVFTNEVRTAIMELLHVIPLVFLSLGAYLIRSLILIHERRDREGYQNLD